MNHSRALAASDPAGETARLDEVAAYRVMGTWPETSFDEITQLIGTMFAAPMALVSIVGRDRLWLKSSVGIASREIPRSISFCSHTIMSDRTLVVPDTLNDPRFRTNPLVRGEPRIRFYAGAPLVTRTGFRLGALCALDTKPRGALDLRQEGLLRNFADLVVTQLELRCDRLPN